MASSTTTFHRHIANPLSARHPHHSWTWILKSGVCRNCSGEWNRKGTLGGGKTNADAKLIAQLGRLSRLESEHLNRLEQY